MNSQINIVIALYPDEAKQTFLEIYEIVAEVVLSQSPTKIELTTKWNEPAFVPTGKIGTTLRIAWNKKSPNIIKLLVHCRTSLIERWRVQFPQFECEGNRALCLEIDQPIPKEVVRFCAESAFNYDKRNLA